MYDCGPGGIVEFSYNTFMRAPSSSGVPQTETVFSRAAEDESRLVQLIVAGVCIPYGFIAVAGLLILGFWNWKLVIPLIPTTTVFVAGVYALRRNRRWPAIALGGSLYMLALVMLGTRGSPRTWFESACAPSGLALFVFPLVLAGVAVNVLWGRWKPTAPRADHSG